MKKQKIKLPIKYIPEGGIIVDDDDKMLLEVRGWGWITNRSKKLLGCEPQEFQDSFALKIVELLNAGLIDTDFIEKDI